MDRALERLVKIGEELDGWLADWDEGPGGLYWTVWNAYGLVRNAEELLRQEEEEEEEREREVHLRSPRVKARLDKGILFGLEPGDSGEGAGDDDGEAG